jgi:hypothetical protein
VFRRAVVQPCHPPRANGKDDGRLQCRKVSFLHHHVRLDMKCAQESIMWNSYQNNTSSLKNRVYMHFHLEFVVAIFDSPICLTFLFVLLFFHHLVSQPTRLLEVYGALLFCGV